MSVHDANPLPPATLKVWPVAVRLAHGLLAASVIGCLILFEGGRVHEALGYLALAIAAMRVVAGFGGLGLVASDSPARFARFVTGAQTTVAYGRNLLAGREPRHVGHNPLGGWMVVALLAMVWVAAGSGALYVTDRFWGHELVMRWHAIGGWALLGLLPLHVAGVVFTSIRHRENLVRAMLDGKKRPPGPGDVPS